MKNRIRNAYQKIRIGDVIAISTGGTPALLVVTVTRKADGWIYFNVGEREGYTLGEDILAIERDGKTVEHVGPSC